MKNQNIDNSEILTYTTLKAEGEATLIEKKSRFIGHCKRVTKESEAIEFINKIKSENTQANHNVYAYIIKENNIQRYSDDSEPQGTAGIPVLDIIRKNNFTDAVIVVTRYFGGVLLGTGGLVRAYSSCAKAAVDNAEIVTYVDYTEFEISCSYNEYQKIQNTFENFGIIVDETVFEDRVKLKLAIKDDRTDAYFQVLSEMSQGVIRPIIIGNRFDCE